MATIFAAFGKAWGNNKGSIQNFGIVGITIATEEISKFIFFYCPCDYPRNQTYGSIFIWGPSAVLLIAGYLANRRTWRLTTGLCHRTQTIGRGGKRIFHFIFIFLSIGGKSMIAPATWVVLAFLKGDYYACAHWPDPYNDVENSRKFYLLDERNGSVPLPKPCLFNPNPAKFSAKLEAEIIARTLRAESHIIGWFYLTVGMLLSVIFMFCMRCQSNFSYEQYNYIDRYRVHEIELFEDKLDAKAKEQADRIVNGYFAEPRAKEEWDKIAVINDKVTHSKRGKAIYSPLHRFVNKEFWRKKEKNPNEEVCVDLVQDSAMKKKNKQKLAAGNAKNSGSTTTGAAATAVPIAPAAIQMMPIVVPKSKTVIVPTNPPDAKKEEKPVPSKDANPSQSPGSGNDPSTATCGVTETKNENLSSQQKPSRETQQGYDKTATEHMPNNEDCFTSPSEVESPSVPASTTAAEPNLKNLGRCSPITSTSTSPPPQKQRPQSFPSGTDPLSHDPLIRETSLGDFGGYFSREDVMKSVGASMDEIDQGKVNQSKTSSDQEISDNMVEDEESEPLLDDVDEEPLLNENV